MSKTRHGLFFDRKLTSFNGLSEAFSYFPTYIYHNFDKILQINLDISKAFGFGVITFYTTEENFLPKGN